MTEVSEIEVEESVPLIDRWNRWLLGLLALEIGIVTFVFIAGVGAPVVSDSWSFQYVVFDPLLQVLAIVYLGNLIGALGTLILALRKTVPSKDMLGLGHLVNLIYVVSGWVLMAAFVFT